MLPADLCEAPGSAIQSLLDSIDPLNHLSALQASTSRPLQDAEPSADIPHCPMATLQAVLMPHTEAHAVQWSLSIWLASKLALQVALLRAPCSIEPHKCHVVTPFPGVPLTCMLAYTLHFCIELVALQTLSPVTPLPRVLLTRMLAYTPTPAVSWQHCKQSHLQALAVQGLLQQLDGVLADSALVVKLLGPLDQLAPVEPLLLAGEAEAEAHQVLLTRALPATTQWCLGEGWRGSLWCCGVSSHQSGTK